MVSCEMLWMLSDPQTWPFIYLGLLIWLGFTLLGQIIRLLFRKWLSDEISESLGEPEMLLVKKKKSVPCHGCCCLRQVSQPRACLLPVCHRLPRVITALGFCPPVNGHPLGTLTPGYENRAGLCLAPAFLSLIGSVTVLWLP